VTKQTNELFWAFVIALFLASYLATIGYLHPGSDTARQYIFQIANGMVTGALGFFAGRVSSRLGDSQPPGTPK
jgi:hypothetical protein